MSFILSGQVVPSGNIEHAKIAPNSRVHIQLLDVSLMDAPSVTLAEQIIHVGQEPFSFPISFNLTYDPSRVLISNSYSVSARVSKGDDLEWVSTSRHSVLTQGNPTNGVSISVDNVSKNGTLPGLTKLSGRIVSSPSTPASKAIAPNSRIIVQLLDVSLMDAHSVTLAEQKILTAQDQSRSFPISRSVSRSLTWITTSTHSVLTRGEPKDGVEVTLDVVQH
ncbi:hypothetical protein BGW38_009300 [Lunasporangiospora selenospora]|uniref:Uncharacterized protein n=1 Tax=Lunasporangiospora selenospora TaxID=979761 RepID=A0A9P6K957_9FUNG|nr:hypothetical protein BGW38_009300 [Lunasporangiospora selenospora]